MRSILARARPARVVDPRAVSLVTGLPRRRLSVCFRHPLGAAALAGDVLAPRAASSGAPQASWERGRTAVSPAGAGACGSARALHTTAPPESTIIVGSLAVAAAATAGLYGLKAFERYKARTSSAEQAPGAPAADKDDAEGAAATSGGAAASSGGSSAAADAEASATGAASKSGSSIFGGQAFARRFYKGGFEDKMTKREASLILGVRESADVSRIRDRHRKLLMQNHPDTGGSTFIATKINEAKEMLLGKSRS